MKEVISTVKEVVRIADNVYSLTVALPEPVGEVRGGQFLNISTGDNSRLLKRPFGIVRAEGCDVTVCFQVKGEGTQALANARKGDELSVLLPLGNGFILPESAKVRKTDLPRKATAAALCPFLPELLGRSNLKAIKSR